MSTARKKCRVCGKEYKCCHNTRQSKNIFQWQDVACCPEHGSIYFANIQASRVNNQSSNQDDIMEKPIDNAVEFIDDEYDELFEEDFDDDAEETIITK